MKTTTARNPNTSQKKLITAAGLDASKLLVRKENSLYLYLTDRGIEQRENIIIDKLTSEIVRKMP